MFYQQDWKKWISLYLEWKNKYRNSKYKTDKKPLDIRVNKFELNKYSKSYINHLFNTNEMLGAMILTLNNINFYQELMYEIRKHIKKGTFLKFYNKFANKL